jgi:hypothetical protein
VGACRSKTGGRPAHVIARRLTRCVFADGACGDEKLKTALANANLG